MTWFLLKSKPLGEGKSIFSSCAEDRSASFDLCVWCFTRTQHTGCDEFCISCCVYDAFVCFMTFCHILVAAAALMLEMNFPAGRNKVDLLLSNLLQYEAWADRSMIKHFGIRPSDSVTSVAPGVPLESGFKSGWRDAGRIKMLPRGGCKHLPAALLSAAKRRLLMN